MHQNFVILGTIFTFVGCFAYIIDVIKGVVKPNKVSFLLSFIVPLVAFVAQIKESVGIESLMTFSN
ncbi:MAG: hypothetical protein WCO06_00615 [Candidatus Roizmanbacteria bacterium]